MRLGNATGAFLASALPLPCLCTYDQTQVSCIAGRFFTIQDTREAIRTQAGSIKQAVACKHGTQSEVGPEIEI